MTISPAETTHDERVGSTLYASIWLIFLAFPVVGLLRSAHGPAAMAVGAGSCCSSPSSTSCPGGSRAP